MKARYMITCNRCGYEWTGKKNTKTVVEMITKDGVHYRLCEDCICDIGRAETEEERLKIIEQGKIKISEVTE